LLEIIYSSILARVLHSPTRCLERSLISHSFLVSSTDTREPKSSKKKKKDPSRPLSPMQESVDESPVAESRVPRSVDYDTGMRRSKYQGDMSQGRGQDRGQGRGQGRGNQQSEYSGGEMKIDGPWRDDEGIVHILYLRDRLAQPYDLQCSVAVEL
jgi:hypothetical protein